MLACTCPCLPPTLHHSHAQEQQHLCEQCCRLRDTAYDGYYHRLPFLITDLSGQYDNYTAVEPCMDSFLYRIEHINETVIALPPAVEVSIAFPAT